MTDLYYEYLIRAVFKCGRSGRFGADADIYRALKSVSDASTRQNQANQFELGLLMGEVTAYLRIALYEVMMQQRENEEFTTDIDKCLAYLRKPSMANIDKCIQETWKAFDKIGLYAE
jgi:predicted nucleotide-binding protein